MMQPKHIYLLLILHLVEAIQDNDVQLVEKSQVKKIKRKVTHQEDLGCSYKKSKTSEYKITPSFACSPNEAETNPVIDLESSPLSDLAITPNKLLLMFNEQIDRRRMYTRLYNPKRGYEEIRNWLEVEFASSDEETKFKYDISSINNLFSQLIDPDLVSQMDLDVCDLSCGLIRALFSLFEISYAGFICDNTGVACIKYTRDRDNQNSKAGGTKGKPINCSEILRESLYYVDTVSLEGCNLPARIKENKLSKSTIQAAFINLLKRLKVNRLTYTGNIIKNDKLYMCSFEHIFNVCPVKNNKKADQVNIFVDQVFEINQIDGTGSDEMYFPLENLIAHKVKVIFNEQVPPCNMFISNLVNETTVKEFEVVTRTLEEIRKLQNSFALLENGKRIEFTHLLHNKNMLVENFLNVIDETNHKPWVSYDFTVGWRNPLDEKSEQPEELCDITADGNESDTKESLEKIKDLIVSDGISKIKGFKIILPVKVGTGIEIARQLFEKTGCDQKPAECVASERLQDVLKEYFKIDNSEELKFLFNGLAAFRVFLSAGYCLIRTKVFYKLELCFTYDGKSRSTDQRKSLRINDVCIGVKDMASLYKIENVELYMEKVVFQWPLRDSVKHVSPLGDSKGVNIRNLYLTDCRYRRSDFMSRGIQQKVKKQLYNIEFEYRNQLTTTEKKAKRGTLSHEAFKYFKKIIQEEKTEKINTILETNRFRWYDVTEHAAWIIKRMESFGIQTNGRKKD